MPLTDLVVKTAKPKDKQYRLPDGKGLNILVHPNGSKYWQLRYRHPSSQKGRLLQLGIYPEMTLAAAREKAREARLIIKDGIDPIEAKKDARREKDRELLNTFQLAANAWYEHEESRWSLSTREKITWILTSKLGPLIGGLPMASLTSRDLLTALNKIQADTGSETAKRALRVAGQVWPYAATTLGVVERDITQELKGQLKSTAVTHRAAIVEPKAFGKLLVDIDKYDGGAVVKAATQLSPLFFCRPGELRQLEWAELNWDKQQFEIAGKKMKMGNDHIIPICRQAMEILKALYPATRRSKYVFAGPKRKGEERPLSENGVRMALNAMGYEKQMTPHGFRASARTLLEEELKFSIDLIEHQSARKVRDPLGRAYNRTQHLDARKEMMQLWADYLDKLKFTAGGQVLRNTAFKEHQAIPAVPEVVESELTLLVNKQTPSSVESKAASAVTVQESNSDNERQLEKLNQQIRILEEQFQKEFQASKERIGAVKAGPLSGLATSFTNDEWNYLSMKYDERHGLARLRKERETILKKI